MVPALSSAREIRLSTPLSEADVRALQLGDHVYLTGTLFSGRSRFHQRAVEEGQLPPIDFKHANILIHMGPVMRRQADGWQAVGMDQTSSLRFEKWGPQLIRQLGLRGIVGKTTMGPATAVAMRDHGCVHLTRVGTPGNLLAKKVKRVIDVFNLEEFGMTEATWLIEVEEMGPFIVDMDARGQNLFDAVDRATDAKLAAIYQRFGIAENFTYHQA